MTAVRNSIIVVQRVVGNREPLGAVLVDADGAPINLTGRTIVFRMLDMATGAVIVDNAVAALDNAAAGEVSYTPAANEVAAEGRYACYFLDVTETPNRRWPYDGARFQLHIKGETDT